MKWGEHVRNRERKANKKHADIKNVFVKDITIMLVVISACVLIVAISAAIFGLYGFMISMAAASALYCIYQIYCWYNITVAAQDVYDEYMQTKKEQNAALQEIARNMQKDT